MSDAKITADADHLPCYHIYMELTRGYIAKLKYLRREKDDDVKYRLGQALNLCKFEDGLPYTTKSGAVTHPQILRLYPKKYKAELVVPTHGFVDRGFRVGTLLDALRTWFGEVVKGDIRIERSSDTVL